MVVVDRYVSRSISIIDHEFDQYHRSRVRSRSRLRVIRWNISNSFRQQNPTFSFFEVKLWYRLWSDTVSLIDFTASEIIRYVNENFLSSGRIEKNRNFSEFLAIVKHTARISPWCLSPVQKFIKFIRSVRTGRLRLNCKPIHVIVHVYRFEIAFVVRTLDDPTSELASSYTKRLQKRATCK